MRAQEFVIEKKDACYHKVRSRYKVWPSAYASGALVQCRKKGAANWGNKTNEDDSQLDFNRLRPRAQRMLSQMRAENPHAESDLEALIFDYRRSQSRDRTDIGRLDRENDQEEADIDALQRELDRLKKRQT
jgi:hypothetical protein